MKKYSSLDCNTVRGQVYIGTQLSCHERIEAALNCAVIATDTTSASDIDALITKNKTLVGLAEVKSREMRLKDSPILTARRLIYKNREYDSYLITFEKLEKLKRLCSIFNVPGFLFVSLLEDHQIVFWKICNANGEYCVDLKKERTRTQATCNGGVAYRENAYLTISCMKVLPSTEQSS